ncbi:tRNA-specific adenosine deaminase [Labrenzia sp. THAF82]|uniref:nucleoside deaminase n=1 Tax=Labrenzia sp. THAF82 TaxID=2587861 RepID=UPI0012686986|nr:nucleoside deaminase [Labrenzia sp. THAF82]QFT33722.1 tRNA-specific adenosine deaminase [Labrenzia sp. THAF82]
MTSGQHPQRDKTFMDLALEEAEKASSRGEVPVGAVLVRGTSILARDGNRTLELNDPTAHAEVLVIRKACALLNSQRLLDCDLYVTLEPCTMCAGAISFARIRRLYYGAGDEKGGAVDHGARFFDQPTCHHAPDTYSGIGEVQAAKLLRAFFNSRRRN